MDGRIEPVSQDFGVFIEWWCYGLFGKLDVETAAYWISLLFGFQVFVQKMEKIAQLSKSQPKLKSTSISEYDVLTIWDALSYVIREELSKRKGVVVPGFGTFTFVEHRLDIGTNNTQLVKMKPFFLLSDKFAQYTRDIVEVVVNEAFTAIDHFIRSDGVVSIPFNGLGVFSVADHSPKPKKLATFKFYEDILSYLPNH